MPKSFAPVWSLEFMCMKKPDMIAKMIALSKGHLGDIEHFIKVHGYAQTLGKLEKLDEKTQDILEIAAIVHDIACPLCREKYGCTAGKYQELESENLLREFFAEFELPLDILERVIFLVCHHHTYEDIDGMDWQLLLEADYLVNAHEMKCSKEDIIKFRGNVFKSPSGINLLNSMYL